VMLFDETEAILLIRFVAPREGGEFVFWARCRELKEELGIAVAVEGPVYRDANMFLHQARCRTMWIFCFGRGVGERSLG